MFTGIIETLGTVLKAETLGTNRVFWIESPISNQFKADQSVAHNGVCLTIEEVIENTHRVTAIEETLLKTNLMTLNPGELVNIERCIQMNGRLDGHFVQGHVDCAGECIDILKKEGSHQFKFKFPQDFTHLVIEKGSICLNGISLTIFDVGLNDFSVAIIPYTFEHTNIKNIVIGSIVNIEFDVIGKYIQRATHLNTLTYKHETL